MDWELNDGARTVGPCSEQDIETAITAGRLAPPAVCRVVGETEWRSLRAHPAFAIAFERGQEALLTAPVATAVLQRVAPAPRRSVRGNIYAAIAIGFGAICAGEVVAAIRGGADKPIVTNVDLPRPPAAAVATTPKLTPMQRAAIDIAKVDDVNLAISVARPLMADTRDEDSDGARLLAIWGTGHAKWSDFNLPLTKLETTYDEVQKNPDASRGKRTCVAGQIIEIHATKFGDEPGDDGLMFGDGLLRIVRFLSVGSSAGILESSPAYFCGVATGIHHYANSGGGTGHAVELVGMFRIPENTKR